MESSVPPNWKPDQVESATEIAKCAEHYSNGMHAFMVHKSGTVVFSDTGNSRPDADYNATLEAVTLQLPDFKVMPMQDGNYLVRFAGPVTGVVLSRFFERHRNVIVSNINAGGVLPGETVLSPDSNSASPSEHHYAGLYARAKSNSDAASLKIVERFSL